MIDTPATTLNIIDTAKREPLKVLALVREIGCYRLGNWDGCCCSHFSVRNVDIEISCGKGGEQAVYVYSGSMDYMEDELLRPIMAEVIRQVTEQSGRGGKFAEYLGQTEVLRARQK